MKVIAMFVSGKSRDGTKYLDDYLRGLGLVKCPDCGKTVNKDTMKKYTVHDREYWCCEECHKKGLEEGF